MDDDRSHHPPISGGLERRCNHDRNATPTGSGVAGSERAERRESVTAGLELPPGPEAERECEYPNCVYQPDGDGDWSVTMPINMHVTAPGEQRALAAIDAELAGLENPRWTRVLPDAPTAAWDSDGGQLVAPDRSVRRPRLGDAWTHVHVWELDADRVALHAHLDVIDLEYAYLHRGDAYHAATRRVREHLSVSNWRRETPYRIEYDVEAARRADWGPTGDTKLEYVPD
ncbi:MULTISPECIES: hypothetical protein [unclassified Natrinema]|uniref:hypothetical protein n=1 Tax=unclassified Natrinema TaxID=2622230 RepID=UPI00026D4594|nr:MULTISPECIES: hypothetical protein [unclassified Natrinema]AFO58337.1 hypothetical protein NJ7G_3116 [Natrinema sp. J7-2]